MAPTDEDIAWLKSTFHPVPKPALPDDCIEYSIYVVDEELDPKNDSEVRLQLREIQIHATELQKAWLNEYIWQRQSFNLDLDKDDGEVCIPSSKDIEGKSNRATGLSFLRGRTEYGDSIEDEWVIVWLLRELSRKFPRSWAKVTDTDGEFLLIEASADLPGWLEPEVAENRVWINNGQLKIIKPARASKKTSEKLSIREAHCIILTDKKRIMHSARIEEQAFHRLRNYPDQIKQNTHHALLTIPRKLAYLLTEKPAYVAPAVEAFYLRDPVSLKPLRDANTTKKLIFAPEDLVTISVAFPRVAYAQIKSQDFNPPTPWTNKIPPPTEDQAHASATTGMKLTSGFEMLLSDPHYQDRPAVREMNLLLEDLDSGETVAPTDETLSKLPRTADGEEWLNIDFDAFQKELQGSSSSKEAPFADKAAQENLQRIVKQFESFLEHEDSTETPENIFGGEPELDSEDDASEDDEEIAPGFGDDDFTKLMQEMMGMPPEVMKELMAGNIDALNGEQQPTNSDSKDSRTVEEASSDDDDDYDEAQIEQITRQIGQELRDHGALPGSSSQSQKAASAKTIKQESSSKGKEVIADEDDSELDEDDPWNAIDENLAKEMLETLQAQSRGSAPPNNLLEILEKLGLADKLKTKYEE